MSGLIARFLPNLIPGLAAFANPWVLLAMIAGAAACFAGGVVVEGWRWGASETTDANDRANELVKRARENAQLAASLSARLAAERAKRDDDKRAFDEELRRAKPEDLVQVSCPAREAVAGQGDAVPSARLSPAAIRLWNRALGVGLPASYGRWGADDELPAAGTPRVGGSQ